MNKSKVNDAQPAIRLSRTLRAVVDSFPNNPVQLIGVALVALALAVNARSLGFLFAPDGLITGDSRKLIWLAQLTTSATGLSLYMGSSLVSERIRRLTKSHPGMVASIVGAVVIAIGLGVVELGFHAYNVTSRRLRPSELVHYSASIWQPNAVVASRKTFGREVVYDVTYRIDDRGARITPDSAPFFTGRDLVFFGGSFTFGQGVEDSQALPNQVARHALDWRVTNLGFPGHGPAHMLERLDHKDALADYEESELVVLDVFIPEHVRRTIGSMRIATTWGREFPLYAITRDDRLEYRGTMITGRPLLASLYHRLAQEPILKCFNVDFPVRLADPDLAFTARIVAESKARVRAANPSADFRVVLFPDRPDTEFPSARLIPFLEAADVPYLDYSNRLRDEDGIWIAHDSHPTPKAYAHVARWIAEDLHLSTAGSASHLTD